MKTVYFLLCLFVTMVLATVSPLAGGPEQFGARLEGAQEVPAVMTSGHGHFHAVLNRQTGEMEYEIVLEEMQGEVLQAHVHLGQPGVNGGVMVFLCSNLGNGPAGTPECSDEGVSGSFTVDAIVGPADQGVPEGDGEVFLEALVGGLAYVNVHTDLFPSGEVRGQVGPGKRKAKARTWKR